mmetsp:Transcript_35372/g.65873  ORF Transcript_35372/g.65873 Transcript_35372/m.65873 type:complete len:258 (-) Transcript_35372:2-775(-)
MICALRRSFASCSSSRPKSSWSSLRLFGVTDLLEDAEILSPAPSLGSSRLLAERSRLGAIKWRKGLCPVTGSASGPASIDTAIVLAAHFLFPAFALGFWSQRVVALRERHLSSSRSRSCQRPMASWTMFRKRPIRSTSSGSRTVAGGGLLLIDTARRRATPSSTTSGTSASADSCRRWVTLFLMVKAVRNTHSQSLSDVRSVLHLSRVGCCANFEASLEWRKLSPKKPRVQAPPSTPANRGELLEDGFLSRICWRSS